MTPPSLQPSAPASCMEPSPGLAEPAACAPRDPSTLQGWPGLASSLISQTPGSSSQVHRTWLPRLAPPPPTGSSPPRGLCWPRCPGSQPTRPGQRGNAGNGLIPSLRGDSWAPRPRGRGGKRWGRRKASGQRAGGSHITECPAQPLPWSPTPHSSPRCVIRFDGQHGLVLGIWTPGFCSHGRSW